MMSPSAKERRPIVELVTTGRPEAGKLLIGLAQALYDPIVLLSKQGENQSIHEDQRLNVIESSSNKLIFTGVPWAIEEVRRILVDAWDCCQGDHGLSGSQGKLLVSRFLSPRRCSLFQDRCTERIMKALLLYTRLVEAGHFRSPRQEAASNIATRKEKP